MSIFLGLPNDDFDFYYWGFKIYLDDLECWSKLYYGPGDMVLGLTTRAQDDLALIRF